jgi:hypothetical protein
MGHLASRLPTFLPTRVWHTVRVNVAKFVRSSLLDPVAQLVEQRTFNP